MLLFEAGDHIVEALLGGESLLPSTFYPVLPSMNTTKSDWTGSSRGRNMMWSMFRYIINEKLYFFVLLEIAVGSSYKPTCPSPLNLMARLG